MKISYAITVCNEFIEIQRLVNFLILNKKTIDEIIIQFDRKNGDPEVENYLKSHSSNGQFQWHYYDFDGNFADMKNHLSSLCSGDYIFQIDADEMISEYMIQNIGMILQYNSVDILKVPRINTVKGLTQEHIQKWRWRVDDKGWVNFPDYQWRIYKNNSKIRWKNKVHEVLEGYKTLSFLPEDKPWCLLHDKTIEKQEKQNEYYEKL